MEQKTLSVLEQEIMEHIWEDGNSSVTSIHKKMGQRLAYTTIATLVQRLQQKGLVSRQKSVKGYIYTPKLSRLQYTSRIAKNFVASLFSSYGDTAVASFAESIDTLPKEKKDYLLTLLRDAKGEK